MKKYVFKYEKILDYRIKIEEEEKNRLAKLVAEKERIQQIIKKMRKQQEDLLEEINNVFKNAGTAADIMMIREYREKIEQDISEQEAKIEIYIEKIRKQKEILTEAMKQVKIMEKLKERSAEEYRIEFNRYEQKLNDEMASKSKSKLKSDDVK